MLAFLSNQLTILEHLDSPIAARSFPRQLATIRFRSDSSRELSEVTRAAGVNLIRDVGARSCMVITFIVSLRVRVCASV